MNHEDHAPRSLGLPLVSQPGPAGAVDPVCGMTVDPARSPSHAYDGTTYYFCCPHCLARFRADPAKYLNKASRERKRPEEVPGPPGAIYTCPMHPEIEQDHPGSCPLCGMALEPKTVAPADGPNPELIDMTRRFWVGAALSLPVFLIAMAPMVGIA